MELSNSKLTIITRREQPDLADKFWPQKERIWPQFMFHDVYSAKYWSYTYEVFDDYQLYLVNESGQPVAVAHTMPCVWNGTLKDLPVGWADSLVRGANDYDAGRQPNTLVALEISIQPEYRGQGVSYRMIRAVRELAESKDYQAVIVAVRPSQKMHYPITPLENYVRWQQEDGAPFDPWLRAHWRSGGEILKTADPSLVAEAPVEDWESWTGMKFPESGEYVIPDALVPIKIDRTMNVGRYIEPNVWVHHPITTRRLSPEPGEG